MLHWTAKANLTRLYIEWWSIKTQLREQNCNSCLGRSSSNYRRSNIQREILRCSSWRIRRIYKSDWKGTILSRIRLHSCIFFRFWIIRVGQSFNGFVLMGCCTSRGKCVWPQINHSYLHSMQWIHVTSTNSCKRNRCLHIDQRQATLLACSRGCQKRSNITRGSKWLG